MDKLDVIEQSIGALRPYERNPRTHSPKQIKQIARSIEEFGWTNPVLLDDENRILAGHGRVAAAKTLGIRTAPTIRLSHLTEAQRRAYIVADNKLAENAGWDKELLAGELQYLLDSEFEIDVSLTGFETAEIDLIIQDQANAATDDVADEVPELNEKAVTEPGDLWLLGRHRLLCADATDRASYSELMGDQRAQLVFTDPPYNVPIQRHVCGLGKIQHSEFAMASGEMSAPEFETFLASVFDHLSANSVNGAIHFICMDWRHMTEVLVAGRQAYSECKNLCVWAKTNGGMGSLYRSQHELVFVFKNGRAPHINNVDLGRHGRYRTNVWTYPGVNAFGSERLAELGMHPTVKPVAMVKDAILDCSHRNGIVLDAFCGSGTTILAAEQAGRICHSLELDPRFVDVAIKRWCALTGKPAIHESSGLSFEELS